jgi:hypothetical protein
LREIAVGQFFTDNKKLPVILPKEMDFLLK